MKTYTIKLNDEQINTIAAALNGDYHRTLKAIEENADNEIVKRYWAKELIKILNVNDTLFDAIYPV